MPYAAKLLSSEFLKTLRRWFFALKRRATGGPKHIDVFIKVDDPYSFLLIQILPELIQRYDLTCQLLPILHTEDEMFPDKHKWLKHSLVDAKRLADLYQLDFSSTLPNFDADKINAATISLLKSESIEQSIHIFGYFWLGEGTDEINNICSEMPDACIAQLEQNQGCLKKMGHYLPATVYFEGEWYWGIDRLDHFEERLNLELDNTHSKYVKYDLQHRDFCRFEGKSVVCGQALEMFFSARSPYSYIGLEKAINFCEHYGIELKIKLVLPMMMRAMNVPNRKKLVIFHDAKREANKHGIPYGFVADPLGQAVENCYGLYQYAQQQNRGVAFLLAFARAVNAKGIRADQDRGLKCIVESAGLDWQLAKPHVSNQHWRQVVEDNIQELAQLGLWGVPCFRYGDLVVWGQDRLWVIEQKLQ